MASETKFKETEIGMIPEDWEIKNVGYFCRTITSGGTPSRKNINYWEGGTILWLKTKELSDNNIYNTEEKITELGLKKSSAKVFPENTIIMAMYGATVGQLGILKKESTTNQACCAMIVDELKADYSYLYYSLLNSRYKFINLACGAAQQNLNQDIIKQFKLPYPPVFEQKKIVSILKALDNKIELNRQMNSTLEQIAQNLFKRWFIDFEFLDENGNPYKSNGGRMVDSELGEIPEGWEVKQIGDICETFGGGTPKTSEPSYWEGGDVFWATPTDMTSLKSPVIFDTSRKITEKGLQNSSAKLLPVGSILMTSRATLGYFAIAKVPISTNQGFISMVCSNTISKYYLLNAIQNKIYDIENLASGSTFLEINKTSFRSIKIILSPTNMMKKFDDITDPIYEEIFQNELETKKLAEIRDSLLPKLMSGKIRVEC